MCFYQNTKKYIDIHFNLFVTKRTVVYMLLKNSLFYTTERRMCRK